MYLQLIKLIEFLAMILLLINLTSCIGKNRKSEGQSSLKPPYYIDWEMFIDSDKEIKNLSEIAKNISYIKLTTSKDNPLGEVVQIHKTDNFILIVDRKDIKLFTKDGTFLRNIGAKGRGPDEYESLLYIMPDENKKIIIITDANNRRLYFYSFSGEFLKRINLNCKPYLISKITSGLYCISVLPEPQESSNKTLFYIIINESGDIFNEYRATEKIVTTDPFFISSASRIDPCKYGTFITPAHNDTTYLLTSDLTKEPFIISKYGKYKLPETLWDKTDSGEGIQNYIYNSRVRLLGNKILASYTFNNKFTGALWDIKSGSVINIELKLKDDLDNGPDFFLSYIDGNTIFDKIEPFVLLRSDTLLHKIRRDSKLFELTNELTEYDNTIIRIAELK